jgi:hypothetical protein
MIGLLVRIGIKLDNNIRSYALRYGIDLDSYVMHVKDPGFE